MKELSLPEFEKPSFFDRLKSMLGVDFYRLFHTPMYYIFLAIAAIIPAMVLSMTGMQGQNGSAAEPMYTNTWQMIAAGVPMYVVKDIADYANMNMVFIFGGIMVSVFIGHDYRSGYVKQLFTTHPKKRDYMISKSLTGAFSMASMCVTYLLGTVMAGAITGTSFEVNFGSLAVAILSKMILSLGWSSLYTFINVLLRKRFGVAIALCFFIGTGIPVIGAAAIVGNNAALNALLYGSSVYACLTSGAAALLVAAACSLCWAIVYNAIGSVVLSHSDVY